MSESINYIHYNIHVRQNVQLEPHRCPLTGLVACSLTLLINKNTVQYSTFDFNIAYCSTDLCVLSMKDRGTDRKSRFYIAPPQNWFFFGGFWAAAPIGDEVL